jgi:hypothetical protein
MRLPAGTSQRNTASCTVECSSTDILPSPASAGLFLWYSQSVNYELAQQLKDAGFPQIGNGRWLGPSTALMWRSSDRVYVPTLEELIDACGMEQVVRAIIEKQIIEITPKAIAGLWLALNKKWRVIVRAAA